MRQPCAPTYRAGVPRADSAASRDVGRERRSVIATWSLEDLSVPAATSAQRQKRPTAPSSPASCGPSTRISPDVLAVEEVGDADAVDDLAPLDGDWHTATSSAFDDNHRICVGFLSAA
jgi:hypothetical protein